MIEAVLNWLNRASHYHWVLAKRHAQLSLGFQQQMTDYVEEF